MVLILDSLEQSLIFLDMLFSSQVSFKQFNYICQSILPHIGNQIQSLVVSNDWKGVLSKTFLNYFGERISLTFPSLRCLILPTFRISSMMLLLDCLRNLSELTEIKIMSLYEMGQQLIDSESVLHRIFSTNNNCLHSIFLDDDSLSFTFENKLSISYPNIKKLVIEIEKTNDLHRLLTALSELQYLDVNVNEISFQTLEEEQLIPILTLKYFRLRSIFTSWNLKDLLLILKRICNVQQLFIEISTDSDIRLLDGQEMFSHFSLLSLTKFSYFIQYNDPICFDNENILSNWEQFNQEFICIQSDDETALVLCTIPINITHLLSSTSIS